MVRFQAFPSGGQEVGLFGKNHEFLIVGFFRCLTQIGIQVGQPADPQQVPVIGTSVGVDQGPLRRKLHDRNVDTQAAERLPGDLGGEPGLIGIRHRFTKGGAQAQFDFLGKGFALISGRRQRGKNDRQGGGPAPTSPKTGFQINRR